MVSGSPAISSDADPLAPLLTAARATGRRLLIPYLTAGFPEPAHTGALLDLLADSGADAIELGVPFSDPVADGPTIQRASQRALDQGVHLAWTLDAARAFRERRSTPIVLFSYLNPILAYGTERFLMDASDAGIAGLLLTDLPAGGDTPLERAFQEAPFAFVRLVAPTTPRARLLHIAASAQGFLYYVARLGVTGAHAQLRPETLTEVQNIRDAVRVPVVVGFGISTPEQAAAAGSAADGVIVGSALLDALERGGERAAVELMTGLRRALD